jgi:hypothetical protein
MSYHQVYVSLIPKDQACPKCSAAGTFRNITLDEYNVFQSGTTNTAAQVGQMVAGLAIGVFHPQRLIDNFTTSRPPFGLLKCERCDSFVICCPYCTRIQLEFPRRLWDEDRVKCQHCGKDSNAGT